MATDRTVLVRLKANPSQYVAAMKVASAATRDLFTEIDRTNDRTAWLAQGILALTPAVTTLGAGAVPVISGLATQMTAAAGAAGVMALGFNGVGDALGALNDYQLDPSVENMEKLSEAMAKVGPEGEAFVRFLDSLGPQFAELANLSREGMFPGMTEGIESFMDLMPRLAAMTTNIADAIGELSASAGADLAGDEWAEFFEYLENEAGPLLVEMGNTIGNFMQGLGSMMVAFGPLTDSFSSGFESMSESFANWAAGLEGSQGFAEFLEYVQRAGPLALDFLGSLSLAIAEIVEAAAPVGEVMLPVLTSLLDVIGQLADTPLGPLVIGLAALTSTFGRLSAAMALVGSGVTTRGLRTQLDTIKMLRPSMRELGNSFAFAAYSTGTLRDAMDSGSKAAADSAKSAMIARTQVTEFGKAAAPVAGQVALLGVAASGMADKMGATNTVALALAGSLAGPWGAAIGAATGLTLDFAASNDSLVDALRRTDEAMSLAYESEPGDADIEKVAAQYRAAYESLQETGRAIENEGIAGAKAIVEDIFGDNDYYEALPEVQRLYAELQELRKREMYARQEAASDKSLYNSIVAETAVLEDNIAAMRAKREEAIRGLNAELDYRSAILDAKDALKENGRTVDENTRAGQANLRALYSLADAWNAQDDATKASRANLRAARANFIETAQAMGMGEGKARDLARALFELPAKVPIKIGVDHETAMAHARAIKAELASIDRFIPVNIHVSRTSQGGDLPYVSGGQRRKAMGGPVYGPGTATSDSIPAYLSNGEYVIKAAAVQKYGTAMFDHLNAMRFADGGKVGADKGKGPMLGIRSLEVANLIAEFGSLARAIRASERAVTRETAERDKASEALDATRSQMADLAAATTSGFQTGLFATQEIPGDAPWSAGARGPRTQGGWLENLTADIAGLRERDALQNQLASAGLSGSALAAALSQAQGAEGNAQLQALISSGQVGQFAALFAEREALTASVGRGAGQIAYGAIEREQQQELLKQTDELRQVKAEVQALRNDQKHGPERVGAAAAEGTKRGGNTTARRRRRDGG